MTREVSNGAETRGGRLRMILAVDAAVWTITCVGGEATALRLVVALARGTIRYSRAVMLPVSGEFPVSL